MSIGRDRIWIVAAPIPHILLPAICFHFHWTETGALTSLVDTSTGTNYLQTDKARSLISIYLDEKMVTPSVMSVSSNDLTFTFTFEEGVTATVEVEEKKNYAFCRLDCRRCGVD